MERDQRRRAAAAGGKRRARPAASGGSAKPAGAKARAAAKAARRAEELTDRAGTAGPPDSSSPKSTRPPAGERRGKEPEVPTAEQKTGRKLDAFPDRIDVRDWFYQPRLVPLPDQIVNCDSVPDDGILDQGQEGACTGYALAAVVNFLLRARNVHRRVSPRMLYEMARRYDEWPGEAYEGSSARGAMKGWVAHGVCREDLWAPTQMGYGHLTDAVALDARGTPGGAFYRVMQRQVRDIHAAIAEVGIVYVTLMVHKGWDEPAPAEKPLVYVESGNLRTRQMPVIQRRGQADAGHAVALVGYTRDGFIVQNSWGRSWGADGFALLPYEDFMLHATDVWVAQLGVPVSLDVWVGQGADTAAGLSRAAQAVPLAEIRPYVIDVGDDGRLSDSGEYWTSADDVRRLFAESIPAAAKDWETRRVMLYLHGGLNDEKAVAARVVGFRDVMLANHIYPLHIMWETGVMESIRGILAHVLSGAERAGSIADWMNRARDGLIEAKDRTFELTVAGAGTQLWDQMKRNAATACDNADPAAVANVVAAAVASALAGAGAGGGWELHVVGHSAGSIFAAHAMNHLVALGVPLKTVQFMAPAITVQRFKDLILPHVTAGDCPHPTMYCLSDVGERDDSVGPYGKSLLYLVSNAFERTRGTPLLGMERFVRPIPGKDGKPTNADVLDPELAELFAEPVGPWPSLVVAGEGPKDPAGGEAVSPSLSRSDSHGGFDNDEWTMNAVMYRILGRPPERPFTLRDLQY